MSKITAAVSPSFNARPKRRPPPSELPSAVAHRRTKTRDVASRYLDTTTSSSLFQSSSTKRCQSPTVTRTTRPSTPSSVTKRPQSTGRRQAVTPSHGGGEVSAAERMLLTSGRSLFATFQADSSYTGKLNSSPSISPRRGTLEKRITTRTRSGVAHQEKSKKLFEQLMA